MAKIAYQGFVYESLNEKELAYIHGKMQHAMEDMNAVLNTVHDGNQKKAMSSLMDKTIDTFNEKIKGVDYTPKSMDELEQQSKEIDRSLEDQQDGGESSNSLDAVKDETLPEKYA